MTATRFVELAPWTMIVSSGAAAVEQPREHWLDASGYSEFILNVEIAWFSGGSGRLRLETSATDDPRGMVLMKNAGGVDSLFNAIRLPAAAAFTVTADSTSPLRRWVRWVVAGGPVSFTFRITGLLRHVE